MNHMITVLSLDQPTVITHIGYRPLGLFAGCRTQIGSVLVNIFLCMNINAGNFYCREYFLVCQTVIPAQVIKSLTVGKIIFLGIFKDIPYRRR